MEPPPRYPILSTLTGGKIIMSSTLVETVSINYEDFNESFLTCSTCLCTYDGVDHIPKLLCCSHTVCLHCLTKIVQSTQNRNNNDSRTRGSPESFRCPICRENITVPRGGVAALPPSFLVNQLMDLMARQRREVVPKCGIHPSQELLFCESCDAVFCSNCTKGSHGALNSCADQDTRSFHSALVSDHTVVPFSIAIKRMSEILLYKANEIQSKLTQAEDNVASELDRLELSKAEAIRSVEDSYISLEKCLRKAKEDALQAVSDLANRKSQKLIEQLDLIKNEKNLVERDVKGMQYQIEVRSLSDRIATLQDKLEAVSALAEPRENSFLVYEPQSSENLRSQMKEQFEHIVSAVGRPRSSTALPSLCRILLNEPSSSALISPDRVSSSGFGTYHGICGTIEAFDYLGCPRREGGDPITVSVEADDQTSVPCSIIDGQNGTYRFWFRAPKAQVYKIRATLFGRPLKNSPLTFEVMDRKTPIASSGSKGSGNNQLTQPSGVAAALDSNDSVLYVLDSGNQRIAKYSNDLQLLGYLSSPAVEGRSATGMCLARSGSSLWIANWKIRQVSEISIHDGRIIRSVTIPALREPVDVAVNSQGQILIADAQQATIYITGSDSDLVCQCGSVGQGQGQFPENNLRAITCGPDDEVIAADCSRIQIFSNKGKFLRTLPSTTLTKGFFGGLAYDGFDHLAASYIENAKNKGSKCGVWLIQYTTGQVLFNFDSAAASLKRPGRLCCTTFNQEIMRQTEKECDDDTLEPFHAGYIYVADDDSIKQYRYI